MNSENRAGPAYWKLSLHLFRQTTYLYLREAGKNRFLILLNFSHRPAYFHPSTFNFDGVIELSTEPERSGNAVIKAVGLAGDEGLVFRLKH